MFDSATATPASCRPQLRLALRRGAAVQARSWCIRRFNASPGVCCRPRLDEFRCVRPQFIALGDLSARLSAIPRLVQRRVPPSEMLGPLLSNLNDVYAALVHAAPNPDGLSLLEGMLRIVTACRDWLASLDVAASSAEECNDELVSFGLRFLSQVLDAVDTSITERYFEKLQPRYRIPGRLLAAQGWKAGQRQIEEVQVSLQTGPETLVQRILACRAEDTGSMMVSPDVLQSLMHAALFNMQKDVARLAEQVEALHCSRTALEQTVAGEARSRRDLENELETKNILDRNNRHRSDTVVLRDLLDKGRTAFLT